MTRSGESLFADAMCGEALEISIVSCEGIPDESILSVRAGSMRRQRTLSQCREPFVFCANDKSSTPLQVDVLLPLATTGPLDTVQTGEHKLDLKSDASVSPAGPPSPGEKMNIVLKVSGNSSSRPPSKKSSEMLQRYVEEHDLMGKLTVAMKRLFRQLPEDPLKFLAQELSDGGSGENGKSPRREENPVESLHVLPICVDRNDSMTRILDCGSGETGFYCYRTDENEKLMIYSNKRKASFFEHWVEPNDVDDFCKALIEEYNLQHLERIPLAVYCGATGLNRDLLLGDPRSAQTAQDFLRAAEKRLVAQLQVPSARLSLFVPSGIIEAQLELRATEWLIGRANLFDSLKPGSETSIAIVKEAMHKLERDSGFAAVTKDDVLLRLSDDQARRQSVMTAVPNLVAAMGKPTPGSELYSSLASSLVASKSLQMMMQSAAFAGTVSAGGGSCQMAMMGGGGADGVLQLFSVTVGNRVPLVEGMFSKPVLPEEREHWRIRVRSELQHAGVPRNARGFFVGISAAFHALKAAKMADKVVRKQDAVDALEAKLEQLPADDQRSISNLTMMSELLKWVFDDEACFLFKRTWHFDEQEYVSTWSLGLYTQQRASAGFGEKRKQRIARSRLVPPISMASLLEDGHGVDALLEVPFIAWPLVPSNLLDFGSGEIGIYQFQADLAGKSVQAKVATKLGKPIYEAFVTDDLVDEFAETIINKFDLEASQEQSLVVAGGATGLHREMLLNEPVKRDKMLEFMGKVEAEMENRLDRRVTLRLFTPSGELEAQYELRAVVWLISQPDVDIGPLHFQDWLIEDTWVKLTRHGRQEELDTMEAVSSMMGDVNLSDFSKAVNNADSNRSGMVERDEFMQAALQDRMLQALVRRTAFCGTISAGGGSSQLSLSGGSNNRGGLGMAQLYSMPIGNRVPLTTGMFSATGATPDERALWVEGIREGLRHAGFPKGLTGLFVGISAMFHAANIAGIVDRIVGKQEVVLAMADRLEKAEPSDTRTVANLTLAKELIKWSFDEKSCFLFKREWNAGGSTHVAGWTLGWYVTQFEGDSEVRERSVCNLQRIARGRKIRAIPTKLLAEQSRAVREQEAIQRSRTEPLAQQQITVTPPASTRAASDGARQIVSA